MIRNVIVKGLSIGFKNALVRYNLKIPPFGRDASLKEDFLSSSILTNVFYLRGIPTKGRDLQKHSKSLPINDTPATPAPAPHPPKLRSNPALVLKSVAYRSVFLVYRLYG